MFFDCLFYISLVCDYTLVGCLGFGTPEKEKENEMDFTWFIIGFGFGWFVLGEPLLGMVFGLLFGFCFGDDD